MAGSLFTDNAESNDSYDKKTADVTEVESIDAIDVAEVVPIDAIDVAEVEVIADVDEAINIETKDNNVEEQIPAVEVRFLLKECNVKGRNTGKILIQLI